MAIPKLLITRILSPLAGGVSRIGEKGRNICCTVCFVALFILYFLNNTFLISSRYIVTYTVGCLLLGMIALMGLHKPMTPIQWDKPLLAFWMGTGVFMLISAVLYNTDYFSEALMFLLIFPVLFVIWHDQTERLFRLMSHSCILSFLLVLAVDIVFFPASAQQYPGLFNNVNGAAFYYVLVFACLTVEIYRLRAISWKAVGLFLLAGLCAALTFYTNSRTGQLGIIAIFIVTAIVYLISYRAEWKKRLLVNILPIILAVAVCIPSAVYVFQLRTVIDRAIPGNQSIGNPNQEKPSGVHGIDDFVEMNKDKVSLEDKTFDNITSGRLSTWKEYVKRLTFFGNDYSKRFFIEARGAENVTAHMMILEFAYRSGIPCGIFFLLFNIFAGIKSIRYALRKRRDSRAMLPLAVTIGFGVISVLSSVNTPFVYMITVYYYFVQAPLMKRGVDEKQEDV